MLKQCNLLKSILNNYLNCFKCHFILQQDGVPSQIIKWFGLAGTFKGHLTQAPCHKQGHLQLDQVAQSPVQHDLECFQGWGTDHLPGHRKKFLPYIQSESPLFQFKTITPCPTTTGPAKKSVPIVLISSLEVMEGYKKVSPECSLLQAEQPHLSQPFLTQRGSSPRIIAVASSGPAPRARNTQRPTNEIFGQTLSLPNLSEATTHSSRTNRIHYLFLLNNVPRQPSQHAFSRPKIFHSIFIGGRGG